MNKTETQALWRALCACTHKPGSAFKALFGHSIATAHDPVIITTAVQGTRKA